jgi:hypothetical protein
MKKFLCAAGAAAISVGTAHAAPMISYTSTPGGNFSAFFGDSPKVASFADTFASFTIAGPGFLTATLSTSGIAASQDIDFAIAEIVGPGGKTIPFNLAISPLTGKVGGKTVTNPDGLELGDITGVALSAGTYYVHITGTAFGPRGNGSYAGTLDFTAAPEPAAWGLMILGFAGAGFAMRRRRSAQRLSVAYS